MKNRKSKKKLILEFLYNVLLGGREYDTEIEKSAPLPFKTIAATVVSTVLVLALIFSFIEISALSSDIGDLKKEAVTLSSKEGKLRDDLNHKYPHAELMDAIEALGFHEDAGEIRFFEETE